MDLDPYDSYVNPYESYELVWSRMFKLYLICIFYTDHIICKFNLNIQINHEFAYLQCKIILKLTKNTG